MANDKHNKKIVSCFSSFQQENEQETKRRRQMTIEERLREFDVLQMRRWGADWYKKPIVKKVTFEKIF